MSASGLAPVTRKARGPGAAFAFLVAFVVLAAVRHWETVPGGAFEAVAVVALGGGLAAALGDRQRLSLLRLLLALALAFNLVSLLSVVQSAETDAALKAWGRLGFAQSLGLGCYLLTSDRRRLRGFTFGSIAGVGLIAAGSMGVLPIGSMPLERIDDVGRLSGPIGDPNFFGQFLVVGLAVSLAAVHGERRTIVRLVSLAVACVILAAAFGTESRGTWLAMSAVAAIHFVRSSRSTRVTLAASVALVVVLVPAGSLDDTTERLTRVPSSVNEALVVGSAEDTAVGGRLSEAIASAAMFRDHPVLGVGIGNYRYRYLDYAADIGIDRRGEERDAHSRHLEVAAEAGILGVVVWSALLLSCAVLCAWSLRRRRGDDESDMFALAWTTAFAGWVVSAVFLHDYQPEVEWLVVGAVFGMAEVVRPHVGTDQPTSLPASSSYSATS